MHTANDQRVREGRRERVFGGNVSTERKSTADREGRERREGMGI